jgi:hypothetical protein
MKKELNPREETKKKMHDITRSDFHALLKKASMPAKHVPK